MFAREPQFISSAIKGICCGLALYTYTCHMFCTWFGFLYLYIPYNYKSSKSSNTVPCTYSHYTMSYERLSTIKIFQQSFVYRVGGKHVVSCSIQTIYTYKLNGSNSMHDKMPPWAQMKSKWLSICQAWHDINCDLACYVKVT